MKRKSRVSWYQFTRQLIALILSVMVIPATLLDLYAQEAPPPAEAPAAAPYNPLDAAQLDQLVAPIALYPDALVAQILTASTYPDQVTEADMWSQQNAGLPPDQRASIANGMTSWDPSIKALVAFPSVLDNLAQNISWTTSLGNAYYNQPADVMNAVQATRAQAQQSGVLASTPQQRVYTDNGAIVIAPVNPDLVYVPYYDPWRIWGPAVVAYPGFYVLPPPRGVVLGVGLGFGLGISVGLFAHFGWGWGAWAPNWRGGGVFYDHRAYFSHSVTVFNHGHFGVYNRGVFEHEGRGVPAGFHPVVTRAAFGRPEARPGAAARPEAARPAGRPEARPAARPEAARPAPAARPEARPEARPAPAARPEEAARPAARPEAARPVPAARPAPARAPAAHAAPAKRPAPAAHGESEKKKE